MVRTENTVDMNVISVIRGQRIFPVGNTVC